MRPDIVGSSLNKRLVTAAVFTAALGFCPAAYAQSRPTLSGTWSASPMIVQYNVGDWGDKCGPRPSGGGPGGGTVTILQAGNELTVNGAGGSYSTTNCFEQMPGLRRVSHSAAPRGWSNRCTTASNDPRQAIIVTSISATDDTISFSETGTYQFVLEGQNCTASVRRTRSFRLVQREGETPTPAASASTAPAPPTATIATPASTPTGVAKEPPPPPATCTQVGEPARIEVRPARKLMRPGEEFTFGARVSDARGCRIDVRPTWSTTSSAITVDAAGTVRVPADAAEGTTDLDVAFSGQHVRVTVEVASKDRYDALLAARGLNERGEADEAAMVTIASGSLGGSTAVGEDAARKRKYTFVGVVGGMAVLLAVGGLLLLRRGSRKKTVEIEEEVEVQPARPAVVSTPSDAPVARASESMQSPRLSCPVCRKTFAGPTAFCPDDGARLIPAEAAIPSGGVCPVCQRGFDASVRNCPEHGESLVPAALYKVTAQKRPAVEPKGKICPTCGARYGGDSAFCGKDGTTLVLVN